MLVCALCVIECYNYLRIKKLLRYSTHRYSQTQIPEIVTALFNEAIALVELTPSVVLSMTSCRIVRQKDRNVHVR